MTGAVTTNATHASWRRGCLTACHFQLQKRFNAMPSQVLRAIEDAPSANLAVCDEHRSLSYAALGEAVRADARWLQERAVERCALLADNSAGWVIADLALLRTGALNVPVPAWFTPAQIAHVIQDAGVESI